MFERREGEGMEGGREREGGRELGRYLNTRRLLVVIFKRLWPELNP